MVELRSNHNEVYKMILNTCCNVIYRDTSVTAKYRATARISKAEAEEVVCDLKGRGWEVIIDKNQPLNTASLNQPIVDVGRNLRNSQNGVRVDRC